jgi:hypothetical protein
MNYTHLTAEVGVGAMLYQNGHPIDYVSNLRCIRNLHMSENAFSYAFLFF